MTTIQKAKNSAICTENPVQLAAGAIKNLNKSKLCIKEICSIVFSSILYYRKYLPDEFFADNFRLENEEMKILKTNIKHTFANHMYRVIFSVHEAIDLGYLKKWVIFVLNNEECQEIHSLSFEYSDQDYKTIMLEQSCSNTRAQTKAIVDTLKDDIIKLLLTFSNTLKKTTECYLFDKAAIAFELFYFEHTPEDYCPELFKRIENSEMKYKLGLHKALHIGRVVTPFHSLKLNSQFKSSIHEQLRALIQNESESIQSLNFSPNDKEKENEKQVVDITGDDSADENGVPNTFEDDVQSLGEPTQIEFEDDVSTIVIKGIHCPCKTTYPLDILLKCSICNCKQHSFCFDMLDSRDCPDRHICNLCAAKNPSLECTVPELVKMDEDSKVERSLFRLILGLSFTNRIQISVDYLVQVLDLQMQFAIEVMERLKKMKLLIKQKDGYQFNKLYFERKYAKKFFPKTELYLRELSFDVAERENECSPKNQKKIRL